ncbi:hypothetical protein FACS189465_0080 [Clostridia bacterium]|nr:hypothetical protein FACS189465_0080 [Clostridia bacterium]
MGYRNVTVSQFKECHSEFKSYSVDQISKALTRLGIESRTNHAMYNGKETTKIDILLKNIFLLKNFLYGILSRYKFVNEL